MITPERKYYSAFVLLYIMHELIWWNMFIYHETHSWSKQGNVICLL